MLKPHKRIYLDHAATTPIDMRVVEAMAPFLNKNFGNPGSLHKEGVIAKQAIAESRRSTAEMLRARPGEIIFVSGGTEANNLAILGFARWLEENEYPLKKCHFITLAIEHPSVLDCFVNLQRQGAEVSYIPVTKGGIIDLGIFKRELRDNTVFVSVMFVNNEIGTVQPVSEIAKILRHHRSERALQEKLQKLKRNFPFFHTDACQAPLYFPVDVQKLGVDYLSFDGQKIYGPKGVGVLYIRKDAPLMPLFYGGKQERALRPGTENVPLVVGLAKALEIAEKERPEKSKKLTQLRNYFIKEIREKIPQAELNGDTILRSPNNVNISIPGTDNEWIVLQLDAQGIAIGTRSACMVSGDGNAAENSQTSYVIAALGKNDAVARSSLRFTMGRGTSKTDIDYVVNTLLESLQRSSLD